MRRGFFNSLVAFLIAGAFASPAFPEPLVLIGEPAVRHHALPHLIALPDGSVYSTIALKPALAPLMGTPGAVMVAAPSIGWAARYSSVTREPLTHLAKRLRRSVLVYDRRTGRFTPLSSINETLEKILSAPQRFAMLPEGMAKLPVPLRTTTLLKGSAVAHVRRTSSGRASRCVCEPCDSTVDVDGDGESECDDCNDKEKTVNSNMPEVCNGIDDDCDGWIDAADPSLQPCSDGDSCTQTDVCVGGLCTGTDRITCVAIDQCHVAGECRSQTGECTTPEREDGVVCNDGNPCSDDDVCIAGACMGIPLECDGIEESLPVGGGTVTTDTQEEGAKPEDPVETWVTTASQGNISIVETSTTTEPTPGFMFLDVQVEIAAPDATSLVIVFSLDASIIPSDREAQEIEVFKDGVLVEPCPNDPCVSAVSVEGDGDVTITVLTSTASDWNFGVAVSGCGNALMESPEECDDGNTDDGDCCSSACRFALEGEPCSDDGNPCTTDACSSTGECLHTQDGSACLVHFVKATKLKIRTKANKPNKNKLAFVSKGHVDLPEAADAPTETPTMLRIRDSSGQDVTLDLPANFWKGLGRPKGAKGFLYKSTGPCRKVQVKRKVIAANCGGPEIDLVLPLVEPVEIVLTTGHLSYCAALGGKVSKNKAKNDSGTFVAKGAAPPVHCATVFAPLAP